MIHIQWTNSAFKELESLPEKLAFEIIRQTDLLKSFPEMGVGLEDKNSKLTDLRQLIIKSKWRIIYDFDEYEKTIYIVAAQSCRQKLLSVRELKRRKRGIE